jgi:hypothetical protein
MNGEPDGAPIVPSFPLADMTAGLYACNAIMFALYHRAMSGGAGQVIDVSLFESLFSLLGPLPAEYSALGRERTRDGVDRRTRAARCYPTMAADRRGSTPGRAVPARHSDTHDPRFATTRRACHAADLAIGDAIASRTLSEHGLQPLTGCPCDRRGHRAGPALACARADCLGAQRNGSVRDNVFPSSETLAARSGGELGQDNAAVFGELGGTVDLDRRAAGVIWSRANMASPQPRQWVACALFVDGARIDGADAPPVFDSSPALVCAVARAS